MPLAACRLPLKATPRPGLGICPPGIRAAQFVERGIGFQPVISQRSTTANLSLVGAGAGSTTIKATSNRNSTVEFSDGTVFVYEMSIPAWQRDTAGKVYIVDYVEARPGALNPKPIGGSYLNLSDALPVPEDQILLAR